MENYRKLSFISPNTLLICFTVKIMFQYKRLPSFITLYGFWYIASQHFKNFLQSSSLVIFLESLVSFGQIAMMEWLLTLDTVRGQPRALGDRQGEVNVSGRSFGQNFGFAYMFYTFKLFPQLKIEFRETFSPKLPSKLSRDTVFSNS